MYNYIYLHIYIYIFIYTHITHIYIYIYVSYPCHVVFDVQNMDSQDFGLHHLTRGARAVWC